MALLWTLTGVYGPQHDVDKQRFMLEMRNNKHRSTTAMVHIG
jgi:hypothetical protein